MEIPVGVKGVKHPSQRSCGEGLAPSGRLSKKRVEDDPGVRLLRGVGLQGGQCQGW